MQTAEQQQNQCMQYIWYDPKTGCVRRQAINFFNRVILCDIDKKER